MNWRYAVGRLLRRCGDGILASPLFPLTRVVPYGYSWPYDVSRFLGTRECLVILDVGANIGQSALHLRRYFPRATIHSFEPIPATFVVLEAHTRRFPRIVAHASAVGEKTGVVAMRTAENSEMSAIVPDGSPGILCRVPITTLDEFCATLGDVALLKIDVEGHELAVLRGANGLLAAGRVRCLLVEVALQADDPSHTPFAQVAAALGVHGYIFSGFHDIFRYGERRQIVGFANALFTTSRATVVDP